MNPQSPRPCWFRKIVEYIDAEPVFSDWRPGVWHAWGGASDVQEWGGQYVSEVDSSAIVEDCETGEVLNVYLGMIRFKPPIPKAPR